jgi:hypothetical protein
VDGLKQALIRQNAETPPCPIQNPKIVILQALNPSTAINLPLKRGEKKYSINRPTPKGEHLVNVANLHLIAHSRVGQIEEGLLIHIEIILDKVLQLEKWSCPSYQKVVE